MARNPTPPAAAAADTTAADTAARLAALLKYNADALKALRDYFGERWGKILARCVRMAMTDEQVASLAGKMMSTRSEWFPNDAQRALKAAATGFLTALSMRDENPAPAPEPVTPEAPAPAAAEPPQAN